MLRAQQLNQANESKSTFERRPSQRFTSRRSRVDRSRPNITSSSSSSSNNPATTSNKTSNNVITNNSVNNSNNYKNEHSNNSSSGNKNDRSNLSQINSKQSNETPPAPVAQQSTVKPNLVISSGGPRHQLPHGKPVKPPTVPPSVSFNIAQQPKPTSNHQLQHKSNISTINSNNNININNNNNSNSQMMTDKQLDFKSDSQAPSHNTRPSVRLDQPERSEYSSTHEYSKSQPLSLKSHHTYINYKPPDTQPPPPPTSYDIQNPDQKSQQNSTKSEDEPIESSITIKKPIRHSTLTSEKHLEKSENYVHANGSINQKTLQQYGELKNSSKMPPPPPPPHTAPRSIPSQTSHQISKHPHAQTGGSVVIKPICVTEL